MSRSYSSLDKFAMVDCAYKQLINQNSAAWPLRKQTNFASRQEHVKKCVVGVDSDVEFHEIVSSRLSAVTNQTFHDLASKCGNTDMGEFHFAVFILHAIIFSFYSKKRWFFHDRINQICKIPVFVRLRHESPKQSPSSRPGTGQSIQDFPSSE
jgi:hypothetical protein